MKCLPSKSQRRSVPGQVDQPPSYGRAVAVQHFTISFIGALCGMGLMLAAGSTQAATITVNTTSDVSANDANCTLREAIAAINLPGDGGGCVGLPAASYGTNDTINLTGLSGTITLTTIVPPATTAVLPINKSTIINGPGANQLAINGNNASRVFSSNAGANVVTINGLTVTGGNAGVFTVGGGINNLGTLNLTNSTVSGNIGDGIANSGTLTLTNSTVSGNSINAGLANGGGIFNFGAVFLINSTVSNNTAGGSGGGIHNSDNNGTGSPTLTLTGSTVSGNTSNGGGGGGIHGDAGATLTLTSSTVSNNIADGHGGAIFSLGNLTLTNSTVSGNQATNAQGGGIHNRGAATVITNSTVSGNTAITGGGINNISGGSMTIVNSTLSGNNATLGDGGGINNAGNAITLTHCTISGNTAASRGGGVADFTGTTTLVHSLISGNSAALGNEIWDAFSGTGVIANSFNLFGHNGETNSAAFLTFTPGASDINATSNGTNVALTSILNTTLANNGGSTQTHALVAGSPAIDAAGACGGTTPTDQRGFVRPAGAACDVGAFELGATTAALTASPNPLDFGSQTIAVPSAPKSTTLKNNSAGTLTLTSPPTATGHPDFQIFGTTCGATLTAGATCTVSVVFTPQAAGTRTATVTIPTDANTLAVTATGTGALVTGGSGGGSGGGGSGSGGGSSGGGDDDGGGCTLGDGGFELGIMAGLAGLALARRRRKPQK